MESRIAVLKSVFMRHGADALSAVTIGALIVYPPPFCIDCEYPNPWSHATTKGEALVAFWLLIAPFLAGVLSVKKGWVVPIVVVAALVVTQPVGGVPWWSLTGERGAAHCRAWLTGNRTVLFRRLAGHAQSQGWSGDNRSGA